VSKIYVYQYVQMHKDLADLRFNTKYKVNKVLVNLSHVTSSFSLVFKYTIFFLLRC